MASSFRGAVCIALASWTWGEWGAWGAWGATPAYHAAVQDAQPLVWYQLAESAGAIVNHGTLGASHNAQLVGSLQRGVISPGGEGSPGGAMGFGPGGYVESLAPVTSALIGNPTFSIEAVVRLASPAPAQLWGPLMHWGDATGDRTGREVYFGIQNFRNDLVYAGFYNAGVRTAQPVPTNAWIHVVWTRQGGGTSEAGSTLYVDGSVVSSVRDTDLSPGVLAAGSIAVGASALRINAGRDLTRYFSGALDEIAVYPRVLSALEIGSRAGLIACTACPADLDDGNNQGVCDGGVTIEDLLFFVDRFALGSTLVDLDDGSSTGTPDGGVTIDDLLYFLARFDQGC